MLFLSNGEKLSVSKAKKEMLMARLGLNDFSILQVSSLEFYVTLIVPCNQTNCNYDSSTHLKFILQPHISMIDKLTEL